MLTEMKVYETCLHSKRPPLLSKTKQAIGVLLGGMQYLQNDSPLLAGALWGPKGEYPRRNP